MSIDQMWMCFLISKHYFWVQFFPSIQLMLIYYIVVASLFCTSVNILSAYQAYI
jgi:hypothetical protein